MRDVFIDTITAMIQQNKSKSKLVVFNTTSSLPDLSAFYSKILGKSGFEKFVRDINLSIIDSNVLYNSLITNTNSIQSVKPSNSSIEISYEPIEFDKLRKDELLIDLLNEDIIQYNKTVNKRKETFTALNIPETLQFTPERFQKVVSRNSDNVFNIYYNSKNLSHLSQEVKDNLFNNLSRKVDTKDVSTIEYQSTLKEVFNPSITFVLKQGISSFYVLEF